MDGNHDISRCREVTEAALNSVFEALFEHGVFLEGMLLKPNMVISGKDSTRKAGPDEIAEATVSCFRRVVPAAVPGILFLSGGQSSEEATENLNAMNAMGSHPWELSFSYGRALQEHALKAWQGKAGNVPAAQKAYHHRARCNSAARSGKYSREMEKG
jgi:fructose-bisphosphate aldolase class I